MTICGRNSRTTVTMRRLRSTDGSISPYLPSRNRTPVDRIAAARSICGRDSGRASSTAASLRPPRAALSARAPPASTISSPNVASSRMLTSLPGDPVVMVPPLRYGLTHPPQPGVEHFLQREAGEGEPQHGQGNQQPRREDPPQPGAGEKGAPHLGVVQDRPPRLRRRISQAEEGERGFDQDRVACRQDELRQRKRDDPRQHVEAEYAAGGCAQGPGGVNVFQR